MARCQMRARLARLNREITVTGGGLAGLALARLLEVRRGNWLAGGLLYLTFLAAMAPASSLLCFDVGGTGRRSGISRVLFKLIGDGYADVDVQILRVDRRSSNRSSGRSRRRCGVSSLKARAASNDGVGSKAATACWSYAVTNTTWQRPLA